MLQSNELSKFFHLLKVFMWAAMHSPEFKYCYFHMPLRISVHMHHTSLGYNIGIELYMRLGKIFVPYSVQIQYACATSPDTLIPDDIPF